MIYPKFIQKGDTIGITAPSDGNKKDIDFIRLDNGKKQLLERGYPVLETAHVRTSDKGRSTDGKTRAVEFEELLENDSVKWIVSAKGGDFLNEMLSHLDFYKLRLNPKWFQGYSDNTGLTFTITTNCDIATLYGCNFNDFGMESWHKAIEDNLAIVEGKHVIQTSFDLYEDGFYDRETGLEDYRLEKEVFWKNIAYGNVASNNKISESITNGNITNENVSNENITNDNSTIYNKSTINHGITMSGRLLGGCFDALLNLVGTPYDKTVEFINKYKEDGIIWYLESYALTSEMLTIGLWHLKEAGWFEYTKGFIFGRPAFFDQDYYISYAEAALAVLEELNVPIILDADIGHKAPQMTIINGAMATIHSEGGKGTVILELK